MTEPFLTSCKSALNNLIASEKVYDSADPFTEFSDAILNFFSHYCLNDHSSSWCVHDKVSFCAGMKTKAYDDNIFTHILFQEKDGKPYQARHIFICKAQADGFKELITTMAKNTGLRHSKWTYDDQYCGRFPWPCSDV